VEPLRVVAVVVVVPLLHLVVEVTRGPWTMGSLRRSSRRWAHPRLAARPHAARMRCLYMPIASAVLVEKNLVCSAARADAMTTAEGDRDRGYLGKGADDGKGHT